jgi:hypothetical protein
VIVLTNKGFLHAHSELCGLQWPGSRGRLAVVPPFHPGQRVVSDGNQCM